MIVTYADDPRVVYPKKLGDTSLQTLVDCASKEVKTLESMSIACAASTTFTLIYNNGTTDFKIYDAVVLEANKTIFINDFHPKLRYIESSSTSQSLKIQAGDADRVTVIAVMIDGLPVKQNLSPSGRPGSGGGNVGIYGG